MTRTTANELHFEMVFNATCFQPISVKITDQSVENVHMKLQKQTVYQLCNRERKAQEQLVNSRARDQQNVNDHLCCLIKWIYSK